MRHLRLLTGLVAAAAVAMVALVAAPVGAATPTERSAAAAKPAHEFGNLKAAKVKGTKSKFFVAGKIFTYKGKRVKIQKSNREKGPYRTFRQGKTNKFGKFRVEFTAAVGTHIRLLVPGTPRNRKSKIYVGQIIRRYS